jgi:4-amino-4-deoxy-L-arabinose transferase-like glycosyltransferase
MNRATAIAGLLCTGLALSAILYTYQLDRVPAYVTLDEAHFAVHAASIARTGRNLNGQILPPLISLTDPEGEPFNLPWGSTYYLPLGMYLIAGALKLLPLSEAAVRTPSALLGGVVNVGLVFFVAHALFRNRRAAAGSALVLALAPANVIISRQALDSVCQPPFILGALWCLATYLRKPDPRLAFAAGVILGCGIYAYVTSIVLMPFYLALFWLIAWRAGTLNGRTALWSIAGFVLAVLPMALWLAVHPEAARSLQIQYNRADPGSATLMETAAHDGIGAALSGLLHIYWSYLDPTFLFVQGGNARNLSTGEAGVFLMPVAILAPAGLYYLRHDRPRRMLLIIGLLVSAIPAAVKGSPYAIQRASGLLIYVPLFAGLGLAALAESRRVLVRAIAAIMIAAMAWQFSGFYRDYLGRYRIASARSYDPTAFRGAAELIIAHDRESAAAAIYLPENYYDVSAKWRFYTGKHNVPSLWGRTRYFSHAGMLAEAPPHSLALLPQPDAAIPAGWSTVGIVNNVANEPTSIIIERR